MEILVTDVTVMGNDHFCVAGWCREKKMMVRPLPDANNWSGHLLAQHRIMPGTQLQFEPSGAKSQGEYPHLTEDTIIASRSIASVNNPAIDWFGDDAPPTCGTLTEIFGQALNRNSIFRGQEQGVYIPRNTKGPSLGAIKIAANRFSLVNHFGALKAIVHDRRSEYQIKVSSKIFRKHFDDGGVVLAQRSVPRAPYLHLRVGLARPWPAEPEKCYVMINGIFA